MSNCCVIFGGSGFIGTHLAQEFLKNKRFEKIFIADITPSLLDGNPNIEFLRIDVRKPITGRILNYRPEWIFNLAAIHREPGHQPQEYYETNINGAENVCKYAEAVGCKNIYFTSSISVYGSCYEPTSESRLPMPNSPYGSSKYPAELIHQVWLKSGKGKRLIICRPGVIYGPRDPGNIMRMIRAIMKGYFFYPGNKDIKKSYGYIYGLIDSVRFTMDKNEDLIIYNYVENPTEPIESLVEKIKKILNINHPTIRLPKFLLVASSQILNLLLKNKSPIHPARVRKASMPTNIVPQYLIDNGFEFRFNFEKSLKHWISVKPDDFT